MGEEVGVSSCMLSQGKESKFDSLGNDGKPLEGFK